MSKNMLTFFKAWIESADLLIAGETLDPHKHMRVHALGLCYLSDIYAKDGEKLQAYQELKALLTKHSPGGDYPFQTGLTYMDRDYEFSAEEGARHLNPRRRAFVEKMIELLEAEQ